MHVPNAMLVTAVLSRTDFYVLYVPEPGGSFAFDHFQWRSLQYQADLSQKLVWSQLLNRLCVTAVIFTDGFCS